MPGWAILRQNAPPLNCAAAGLPTGRRRCARRGVCPENRIKEAAISLEVELKLAAEPDDLADLKRALKAMPPGAVATSHKLVSTYYDTPDRALRRAGAVLRVREEEGRFVQTLKTDGADKSNLLARGEWEDVVADNRPDPQAPRSGMHLPPGTAGDLQPLFVTEIERVAIEVEPKPGTRIEAAVDRGMIRALAGGGSEPVCEIELELKEGEPAALYDLALRLLETAPLHIDLRSKAERGYRLAAGDASAPTGVSAEPVMLAPEMTMEQALQRVGRACLAHLLRNEPAARVGEIEGVHQMRVATRRLRSMLSAVKKMLPEAERRWVIDEIKTVTGALGPARNLDVLATELLPPARAEASDQPGWDELSAAAQEARAKAHRQVADEIGSPRHTATMLRLLRWFEGCGWRRNGPGDERAGDERPGDERAGDERAGDERAGDERAGDERAGDERPGASGAAMNTPIAAVAAAVLDRRRRSVRGRSRHFRQLPAHGRHRVRIAVKKLRYAIELLDNLYGRRDARPFVKRLKRVQDELGHANDVRVAYGLVIELGRAAPAVEPMADAAAQLLARHERALAKDENKLRRHLRRLNRACPFWRV
jgi:inorganic triphosphatase YgiF